jgi:cell division septation protein DedD
VPPLLQGHALVALVSVTGDGAWAASAAWALARAAAAPGRRVALVDLWIEQPQLHAAAGLPLARGIVDAFESGDELTTLAQPTDGVFFIAAGSRTAAPEFVLAHPRWKKLHAGFRSEDALLLIYVPAGALARLSAVPDAVVALAPEGVAPDAPPLASLLAAQAHGATLVGVVRERWTPSGPSRAVSTAGATAPREILVPEPQPGAGRRGGRLAAVLLGLMAVAAGAWALFARSPDAPATAPAAVTAEPPAAVPPAPTGAARARDSLPWTVQLAAYATVENALAHAARLEAAQVQAFVAPVEAQRAVWYRVLAGAYPTREAAGTARDALWADGVARAGEGELLHAPFSLALPDGNADSLRARGVPVVRRATGLLLGAFETRDQAALAQQQLQRAGIPATLIARTEAIP